MQEVSVTKNANGETTLTFTITQFEDYLNNYKDNLNALNDTKALIAECVKAIKKEIK
jgi:hypothetical protein